MPRIVLYVVLVSITSVGLFLVKKESTWTDLLINILASLFIIVIERVVENFEALKLYIQTQTRFRKKNIRISISYLYQIEVNGKYLLVKGHRIANQYQPIGGVYKRYPESFYQLRNLGVTDDNNIPIDDKSDKDLRIKVPGCNVTKFLKWFNSQLGREVSPIREFEEELIKPGFLSKANFPYPNYLFLKRHQTPIHWSTHFHCFEILIADVYKLMPNDIQALELKTLMNQNSTEYFWATRDQIESKRANTNFNISDTASWTL